jgi:hypothetical protein
VLCLYAAPDGFALRPDCAAKGGRFVTIGLASARLKAIRIQEDGLGLRFTRSGIFRISKAELTAV